MASRATGVIALQDDRTLDSDKHLGYTKSRVRLVLDDQTLEEYRCTCGSLLLKGRNLDRSLIQVKCRKCGRMNVNR